MRKLKRFLGLLLCVTLFLGNVLPVKAAAEITIDANKTPEEEAREVLKELEK